MSDELTDIDVCEDALQAHRDMPPLDAMKHAPETLDSLFVEYGTQVQSLNTSTWQIVFGGPGTGKTHLLRVYQERSLLGAVGRRPSRDVVDSLPVYLDATSFASRRFMDDHERRAQACFRDFIGDLKDNLEAAVKGLQSPGGLYARLRDRKRSERARRALELLEEILGELDNARLRYPYDTVSLETTDQEKTSEQSGGTSTATFGVSTQGPSVAVGLGSNEGYESLNSTERRRLMTGGGEPQWHRIRGLIAQLCKELQVRRIDILIDNWPALDTYGNSGVQPHFAELLKKAFGGDRGGHAISIKIAADGLATRLWDRENGVGLRRPDNIETVVNLNEPLLDDHELIEFFEQLLFERLLVCDARLGQLLDPDSVNSPVPAGFVRLMFGDRETFELLVRGAEGRIRLFLHFIRELTRETNGRLQTPWSRERVLAVVKGRAAQEISEYQYRSLAVQLLLAEIKPAIVARNHPVFSISDAEHAKFGPQIDELVYKTLLEPTVPVHYRRQTRPDLLAFSVSSDLMREWARARSIEQELQVIEQELQVMFDGTPAAPEEPTLEQLRIYLEGGSSDATNG